ncbi:MAG TPA: formyltransferase family protein, partial [Hymenobacter sp.]
MSNAVPQKQNSSAPLSSRERRAGGGRLARLAILLSGRGSNMLALVQATQTGALKDLAEVAVVFSNRPDAPGLALAAAQGCPVASLPSQGRPREAFDAEAAALLQQYEPDFVVLAGYMRI